MTRRSVLAVVAATLLVLLSLSGCQLVGGLSGQERPTVGAENGTNTRIELFLDGESLGTMDPGTGMEIASRWRMPPLPWEVEARTEDGRVLVTMTLTAEKLAEQGRVGASAELPGGRFSMWAGN